MTVTCRYCPVEERITKTKRSDDWYVWSWIIAIALCHRGRTRQRGEAPNCNTGVSRKLQFPACVREDIDRLPLFAEETRARLLCADDQWSPAKRLISASSAGANLRLDTNSFNVDLTTTSLALNAPDYGYCLTNNEGLHYCVRVNAARSNYTCTTAYRCHMLRTKTL